MNEYILLEQITIERPIVFLCGPNYSKKPEDRRTILKEEINRRYNNDILPLIIDDFLTAKNINDETISIQLMEEICAAVSVKTYIFLDTLSSAAELGIFANSTYMNKIYVFIPKNKDVYNRNNVGFFVREVSLKSNPDRIKVIEYRPEVKRNAIASDYIVEFYAFVNEKVPLNIKECIDSDEDLKKATIRTAIKVMESAAMPQEPFQICYSFSRGELHINVSIKLLFYVTLSIVSCEYKDFFSRRDLDFSKIKLRAVETQVKNAFFNLIELGKLINKGEIKAIRLNTVLKEGQNNDLIRHIVKFLHVFNTKSEYGNVLLFKNPIDKIIRPVEIKHKVFDVFRLTQDQIDLIYRINSEPDLFFETVSIKKANKVREIVKYREDKNGEEVRRLHEAIHSWLKRVYKYHANSYAYKDGESIRTCVEQHIKGNGFIKYDIKKFFNSIPIDKLVLRMLDEFGIDVRYEQHLKGILLACTYKGKIPLGFITSPLLSDIFMKKADEEICNYLQDGGYTYTRYADDILISSVTPITCEEFEQIDSFVERVVTQNDLLTNKGKKQFFNFDDKHSFLRYLGINIVSKKKGNILSVGKSYINEVAKEYIEFDKKRVEYSNQQQVSDELFYLKLKVIGKIGFIRQIEGDAGMERLKKRLYKYDPKIDLNAI